MSGKSKDTSGKIDRPFAADMLKRAKEIARRYQVIVWFEDDEYYGRGLELPGVMADGKTAAACHAAVQEAMQFAVATLLEQGETPPPAAVEGQRVEQMNIRLTAEEKLELETAAKQQGYRGLGDFVRTSAIAAARMQPAGTDAPKPERSVAISRSAIRSAS